MEGQLSTHLHLWDECPANVDECATNMPTESREQLDRWIVLETLRPISRRAEAPEPFTLSWFFHLEERRYGRHGAWLPRLMEFTKHTGERVLGLGIGLGTDWATYARHGAHVTICATSSEQLRLLRRHFELRGLSAQFLHSPLLSAGKNADLRMNHAAVRDQEHTDRLNLDDNSIDVVSLIGPLPEGVSPGTVVDELFRVLKPGGKILALMPARYDVTYWQNVFLPWNRWVDPVPKELRPERRHSARELSRLFQAFGDQKVYKRHLRRSDLPHLWRCWPLPLLERLIGRFLLLKAFKPLSVAVPPTAAAA